MDHGEFLRFASLSGLIGIFAFCASHAWHVWRRRNAATRERVSLASRIRGVGVTLATLGLMLVVGSCLMREVWRPKGGLSGHELFAVRSRDNLQVDFLFDGDQIRAGEEVARFRDPERQSQIAVLTKKIARLETEQAELNLQPLELDKELTRRHQNASQHRRNLQTAYYQLLAEKNEITRVELNNRLARADKVVHLTGESLRHEVELAQADTQLQHSRRDLDRVLKLSIGNVVTHEELDDHRQAAELLAAEVTQVKDQLKSFENERQQLNTSITTFGQASEDQASSLASEIRAINAEIAALVEEESSLAEQLAEDEQRSLRQRDLKNQQLGFQIDEATAELAGLEDSIVIAAPFDGRVVYRDPAPDSVFESRSLIVLAPRQGGLFQTRLSGAQATALEEAGEVRLHVNDALLRRRFVGELDSVETLPHEPGTVIAKLHCSLPPETVKELAEGEPVAARLLWRPPLITLIPFQLGLAAVVVGGLAWALPLMSGIANRRQEQRSGEGESASLRHAAHNGRGHSPSSNGHGRFTYPVPSNGAPINDNDAIRDGATGPMLSLLGSQLRESILSHDIDPDLLSAIEWALDRHHVRGIRLIRDGLGFDDEVEAQFEELLSSPDVSNGSSRQADKIQDRLRQILRVLDDQECLYLSLGDKL